MSHQQFSRLLLAASLLGLGALGMRSLSSAVSAADAPAEAESRIGKKIANFELQDFRGKSHSLDELRDKPIVVVAFLGIECPLAKLYAPRLAALAKEYEPRQVAFVGINPNSQDSITEIAAYARIHNVEFPILKDVGNKIADQFAAVRTPEVYILDLERTVKYCGRIDDQYAVGSARKAPRQQDLRTAIDELLAGKPVSHPETESVGCHIGRVKQPVADSPVTYSNQIARLLQNRCVECHRPGEIAPFSLTEYSEVAGWAKMIDEVVRENRMPPWHADPRHGKFAGDRLLSDAEKQLIRDWVKNGAPEGNPAELPKPREYVTGWQLPRVPDLVVPMQETPYQVQAEGTVQYQFFTAAVDFPEEKWVEAMEVVPGNRAVVHHVLVLCVNKLSKKHDDESGDFLAAYVPGLRPRPFPAGMAKRIPPNSRLIFQVHYTPNGSPQTDQSQIGLIFADPAKVTHELRTIGSANTRISIPPQMADYTEKTPARPFPEDAQLVSMMPHMHLRGKAFRYEAIFADGKSEILLDVPHYDFNWQTTYRLETPRTFPPNTRILCTAHFDNSENNLSNPDPTKTVRWGPQTWDEMLLGYVDAAIPVKTAVPSPGDKLGATPASTAADDKASAAMQRAQKIVKQYDTDGDQKVQRAEVPERLHKLFDRLDLAKDGVLTAEDLSKVLDLIPGQ